MRCRVEILPTAWEDLKAFEDWYLMNFDADTALKVVDSILHSIERLEDFLASGSVTPDAWLNERGYRMVICERHVSIYRQIEDIIYIYHIADTRTEYIRLFYIS